MLSLDPKSPDAPGTASREYLEVFVESFIAANEEAGPRPTAMGSPVRFSDAGSCARKMGYSAVLGQQDREGMDAAGTWITSLGSLLHTRWQDEMHVRYDPYVETEVKCYHEDPKLGTYTSGHADAIMRVPGKPSAALDAKFVGGMKFKRATGVMSKAGGPAYTAVLQTALAASALDLDEVVVLYFPMEVVSTAIAAQNDIEQWARYGATWTYKRSEWEPMVKIELARQLRIAELASKGQVPPRIIPDPEMPQNQEIEGFLRAGSEENAERTELLEQGEDIERGKILKGVYTRTDAEGNTIPYKSGPRKDTPRMGYHWLCGYCPFSERCAADGPGLIQVLPRPHVDTVVQRPGTMPDGHSDYF